MIQCWETSLATGLLGSRLGRPQPGFLVSDLEAKRHEEETCTISPAKTDKEATKGTKYNRPSLQASIREFGIRFGLFMVGLFNPYLLSVWVHRSTACCRFLKSIKDNLFVKSVGEIYSEK